MGSRTGVADGGRMGLLITLYKNAVSTRGLDSKNVVYLY